MRATHPFHLSRWVFLRLLGTTYLLAFGSMSVQVIGLIGQDGLLPVADYLDRAREFYGVRAYALLPTLTWISASDAALSALCWGGLALSGLAVAGVVPIATFAGLWVLYLSLTVAGQTFLSFQWDTLLLEAGLLACLYAPSGWWPGIAHARAPIRAGRYLLWALAFKLTFLSGVTKLVSGDPTWWGLSALTFHYETQPIPAWTSWFAHHWPSMVHRVSASAMLAVELIAPWLIFVPARLRSVRAAACVGMCLLQVAIAATGNYGFFNLLTIAFYLTLLDDSQLRRVLPASMAGAVPAASVHPPEPRAWRAAVTVTALGVAFVSSVAFWHEATYTRSHPEWSTRLLQHVAPIRSINGYGLFRTMTTERPEVVIEGSQDGVTWTEFRFRWKPGPLDERPGFVQPHMPRLDWLLWFAALDPPSHRHWLIPLLGHLLDGSPAVTALLPSQPLTASPPAFVRVALYDYGFSTPDQRAETGDWWHRTFLGFLTEPIAGRPDQRDAPMTGRP